VVASVDHQIVAIRYRKDSTRCFGAGIRQRAFMRKATVGPSGEGHRSLAEMHIVGVKQANRKVGREDKWC
jgi:hypothetical protein